MSHHFMLFPCFGVRITFMRGSCCMKNGCDVMGLVWVCWRLEWGDRKAPRLRYALTSNSVVNVISLAYQRSPSCFHHNLATNCTSQSSPPSMSYLLRGQIFDLRSLLFTALYCPFLGHFLGQCLRIMCQCIYCQSSPSFILRSNIARISFQKPPSVASRTLVALKSRCSHPEQIKIVFLINRH